MIHTYRLPDCPRCNQEMTQAYHKETGNEKEYWWYCKNCDARSPAERNMETALKTALDWEIALRSGE